MYYASFGLLALVLCFIINSEILKSRYDQTESVWMVQYKHFLMALILYFFSDILWGFLYEARIISLAYADTVLYFLAMVLSVFLWTRCIVTYLEGRGRFGKVLTSAGWMILVYEVLNLIVNFFKPIVFYFNEEEKYIPGHARYITLGMQVMLYIMTSVYTLIMAANMEGRKKIHHRSVGFSGLVMTIFILLQAEFPFLPLYAIGCLIATSVLHIYVVEDIKMDFERELGDVRQEADFEHRENRIAEKNREIYNRIADSLAQEYETIYYIDIDTGKYMEFSPNKDYISMGVPKYWENFYVESSVIAGKYAHPDDRKYAVSQYSRETMLSRIEGKNFYSFQYRIMVNGEPRYFRYEVVRTDDRKHFVVCGKDIQEELNAETVRQEAHKKHVTFRQIAEGLASNYDVIYYVDINNGNYSSFSSNNIYGRLEVRSEGNDFFGESMKNMEYLVYPEDQKRFAEIINRDYLRANMKNRKQIDYSYRMVVDNKIRFTKFTVRKSSDTSHLIIAVEDIDDEIRNNGKSDDGICKN